jgi:hypothetical protein
MTDEQRAVLAAAVSEIRHKVVEAFENCGAKEKYSAIISDQFTGKWFRLTFEEVPPNTTA